MAVTWKKLAFATDTGFLQMQSVATGVTLTIPTGYSLVSVGDYVVDGDLVVDGDMGIM